MKRLLFVDDEQRILDGLRDLLRRHRKQWDMSFALGAEAALEAMRAQPFDVVISDMRMPKMDGAELLALVREEFPSTVRIILSGHTEQEAVLRAVPVAHQFLSKPCDVALLESTIERVCSLTQTIGDPKVREAVGRIDQIPSRPSIYTAIGEKLDDPHATNRDIADLLEQDLGFCAKILKVTNSAFFGLPRSISRVEDAVGYLGRQMVQSLALTLAVFQTEKPIRGISVEALQRHAMMVGQLARSIAPDARTANDAFIAGMLHDFGVLVTAAHLPDRFEQTLASVQKNPRALHVAEQELWGATHAELGAYLIGLWNLPYTVVEAVALHHKVPADRAGFDLVAIVHIADVLAQTATRESCPIVEAPLPALDPQYLEALGVADRVEEWTETALEIGNALPKVA